MDMDIILPTVAESKDVFYTEAGEIEDLEQLLPDIQLKITDMEEMKAASTERLQQAAKVGGRALLLNQHHSHRLSLHFVKAEEKYHFLPFITGTVPFAACGV